MTRQTTIDHIKGIIRRNRRWGAMPNHRRVLCRMIARARGQHENGNDGELLPFWPVMQTGRRKTERMGV